LHVFLLKNQIFSLITAPYPFLPCSRLVLLHLLPVQDFMQL